MHGAHFHGGWVAWVDGPNGWAECEAVWFWDGVRSDYFLSVDLWFDRRNLRSDRRGHLQPGCRLGWRPGSRHQLRRYAECNANSCPVVDQVCLSRLTERSVIPPLIGGSVLGLGGVDLDATLELRAVLDADAGGGDVADDRAVALDVDAIARVKIAD